MTGLISHLPKLALSIRQPWAHAIVNGWKDIENRSWETRIRGLVCIHASALNKRSFTEDRDAYLEVLHDYAYRNSAPPHEMTDMDTVAFGAIIGTARIVDCVSRHDSPWFFGRYGFVLADATALESPIPLKGALGFFDWRQRLAEPAKLDPPQLAQGRLL